MPAKGHSELSILLWSPVIDNLTGIIVASYSAFSVNKTRKLMLLSHKYPYMSETRFVGGPKRHGANANQPTVQNPASRD